ncbi:MAG: DUF4157 domain-containing protein [Myxococcota bacterium]
MTNALELPAHRRHTGEGDTWSSADRGRSSTDADHAPELSRFGHRSVAQAVGGDWLAGLGPAIQLHLIQRSIRLPTEHLIFGDSPAQTQMFMNAAHALWQEAGAPTAKGFGPDTVMRLYRQASKAGLPGDIAKRVHQALVGGEPLPEAVRSRFEQAFNHDFSGVRIRRDGLAAQAADAVNAHAFTVGETIVFSAGSYAPGTPRGDRLLAHELTHVLQHDQGRLPGSADGGVSSPTDPSEQEAYANEDRILSRLPSPASAAAAPPTAAHGPSPSAGAASAPVLRDERVDLRPERGESGEFGTPYESTIEAMAAEAFLRATLIPSSAVMFGLEVSALWTAYLDREPGDDMTPRHFREPTSTIAYGFKHCVQIRDWQEEILDEAQSYLQTSPALAANDWTTVDLAAFAPSSVLSKPVNFSNPYDVPGHIAGGTGGYDAGSDWRSATGSVRMQRRTDTDGATTSVFIEPQIGFTVHDCIDFIPGQPGTGLEQTLTIPLSRLEASGWAHDVPFEVHFTGPSTQRTVDGAALYPEEEEDAARHTDRDPRSPRDRAGTQPRFGTNESTDTRDGVNPADNRRRDF